MTTRNKLSRLPFDNCIDAMPYAGDLYNPETDKNEVWFIADIKGYETETISRTKMVFEIRNSNGAVKTYTHQIDKATPSKPNDVDTVRKKLASHSLLHPNNLSFTPHEILKGLRNNFKDLPYDEEPYDIYVDEDEETEIV
jgi:hypothetical protein